MGGGFRKFNIRIFSVYDEALLTSRLINVSMANQRETKELLVGQCLPNKTQFLLWPAPCLISGFEWYKEVKQKTKRLKISLLFMQVSIEI